MHYVDVHPATNNTNFQVNFRDGSTAYDATKTSTAFTGYHSEDDTQAGFGYNVGNDAAQITAAIPITGQIYNQNDNGTSGFLDLYNPGQYNYINELDATATKDIPVCFATNLVSHGVDIDKWNVMFFQGIFTFSILCKIVIGHVWRLNRRDKTNSMFTLH